MNLCTLFPPLLELTLDGVPEREVTALHSGNLGDIIYSLPTTYALGVSHYILNVCVDPGFGNRALNWDAARKIAPLLLGQGSIRKVSVIASHIPWEYAEPDKIGIDYILDSFRSHGTDPTLHLLHRHALAFGIQVRGDRAWMASELPRTGDLPSGISSKYIVVGTTDRYRRFGDDFYASLLHNVPPDRVIFVGLESDLKHKRDIPGAHLRADDFVQLARVIKGASLMIGNPSFPYALAEAMKVPRLVELPDEINISPLDPSGLAIHLQSLDSLRARIFQALELTVPEVITLRHHVALLEQQLVALAAEKQLADRRLLEKEAERKRIHEVLTQTHAGKGKLEAALAWSISDREQLLVRIDEATRSGPSGSRFKGIVRSVLKSNRITGSVYRMLGRIRHPERRSSHK